MPMSFLNTGEAAELLGVSGATVRNWCRAGHLTAAATRPLAFAREEVEALRERILTNRFNRLRKRANKSASERHENSDPIEAGLAADIARIRGLVSQTGLEASKFLFLAAVHYLGQRGEAKLPAGDDSFAFETIVWRRRGMEGVMAEWRGRLPDVPIPNGHSADSFQDIFAASAGGDSLGLLYQGLSPVGKKSSTGAYFTPNRIIDAALDDLGVAPESFLDPCCGTGRYLIRAAKRFRIAPEKLYGFDSDPLAVDIARLNLLLHYRDHDFIPNVHCLDTLRDLANGDPDCATNHLLGAVHVIATNPPWGGCKNRVRNKNMGDLLRTGESFSLFLEKSLRLLRDGGLLSFVLPEAILKIRTHADIRRLLVAETCIRKISLLGRVFSGVFTPVMRLDLEKRKPEADWTVEVHRGTRRHTCPQARFAANAAYAFDIAVTPRDEELIRKMYDVPHVTLRDNAEWALGIVTGDNSRCVLHAPEEGTEAVLRGRDIYKFAFRPPQHFIHFRPETFQQVAPERFYRAPEKLVYRFVSERLIFAYDNQRLLTLNSANILIPRIAGMPIKAVLAFLNSTVFQYIFIKRFRTRKILRGDLETLPFPVLRSPVAADIEERVDQCMSGDYQPAESLDRFISEIFGLDATDQEDIAASLAAEAETVIL